jgi:hypothetical protein
MDCANTCSEINENEITEIVKIMIPQDSKVFNILRMSQYHINKIPIINDNSKLVEHHFAIVKVCNYMT